MVPADVSAIYHAAAEDGKSAEAHWNSLFERYAAAHPTLAAEFVSRMKGELPAGWDAQLPVFAATDAAKATRQFSQGVLEKVCFCPSYFFVAAFFCRVIFLSAVTT